MRDLFTYSEQLVQIRKDCKLSQKDLAALTGYSQQTISRIENKSFAPSLKSLCDLANAMGYDLKLIRK